MTIATADVLHRGRQLFLPALQAAVARLDEANRRIASYHLGWTDVDGTPSQASGGKTLRPALALLSAEAAGAAAETGVPGAVAVELVHNFSLVHDDLMDGDTERRHRPTVWSVWGSSAAILAGDAMLALAQEILLDSGSIPAARLLTETTRELIRGQVLDIEFERRSDVTLAECLDMTAGKTGSLLSASSAIGAILAGAAPEVVAALGAYGAELGIAFQLIDDLLGIWGDPATTGKPVFNDLRTRKKSLPVTYAVTHGGAAGRELSAWLAADSLPADADLRRAADLVETAGGRAWVTEEAARRIALAEDALMPAPLDRTAREELIALAHFTVSREA
ncbi:polyprenyl synthetase family protein [Fodinicola acaciae]|uniref:polyprenyl synthetase family protein n=1 Tax=Fodinicola acaciae TaxID=2681555 RepID=UPI0013D54913|nr:polyprenyl synthetase family protein [Fodinicola acaciae]